MNPMKTVNLAMVLFLATVCAGEVRAGVIHEPLTCLPLDSSARVAMTVGSEVSVSSARVYFRPIGDVSDYFIEMRRASGDGWVAFLPVASTPQAAITYRLEVKDVEGRSYGTRSVSVKAALGCPVRLSEEDRRMARNLVVGLTMRGQPVVPAGFSSAGIVARISPEGDLQTLLPGSIAEAAGPVSPLSSRTGPAPTCAGCGTLTIGGTSPVSVGDDVIPGPTPPPISPVRSVGGKK